MAGHRKGSINSIFYLFVFYFACIDSSRYVSVLTESTFDKLITTNTWNAMVMFHAPWCGHCAAMAEDYEVVGLTFGASGSNVLIASINAIQAKNIATRFNILGFPSLLWFPLYSDRNKPTLYQGSHSAEAMVDFINSQSTVTRQKLRQLPSPIVTIRGTKGFERIALNPELHVMVLFYDPKCSRCKSFKKDYAKVAETFLAEKNVIISQINAIQEKEITQEFRITEYPALKFFPAAAKDSESKVEILYNGGRDAEDLVAFINRHTGLVRLVGGELPSMVGRSADFDRLALELVNAVKEKDENAIKFFHNEMSRKVKEDETNNSLAKVTSSHNVAHYDSYLRVAQKISQPKTGYDGLDWLQSDQARLQRLLDSNNLTLEKRDLFMVRRNVGAAFFENKV
eukprot:g4039.t1